MSMVIDLVIWLIWIILAFTLLVPMFVLLVMGVLYLMDPRIGCVNRGQVCDFLCKRRHALKTPAKYTAALIIAYFVYCNSGASPIAQVKAGIVAASIGKLQTPSRTRHRTEVAAGLHQRDAVTSKDVESLLQPLNFGLPLRLDLLIRWHLRLALGFQLVQIRKNRVQLRRYTFLVLPVVSERSLQALEL